MISGILGVHVLWCKCEKGTSFSLRYTRCCIAKQRGRGSKQPATSTRFGVSTDPRYVSRFLLLILFISFQHTCVFIDFVLLKILSRVCVMAVPMHVARCK